MVNFKRDIFISKSLRSLHFSTVMGFPSSVSKKSVVSSICELTSFVGSPNCLRYGSMECENFLRVSNPLFKTMVELAMAPPVANYCYSNFENISSHSYRVLFEKNSTQWPFKSCIRSALPSKSCMSSVCGCFLHPSLRRPRLLYFCPSKT